MSQMKKLKIDTEQPAIEDLKLLSVKISKRVGDDAPVLLGTGTIVCDGVDFYVLTAAHCFKDKNDDQNCDEKEIVLTLYDEDNKPSELKVKHLALSDKEEDTAIISIMTPPGGSGYYFEKLKLVGKELNGIGSVFGYTEKWPFGRLFTYKRVNIHVWANQDNITEKDVDFFKAVKGSSGGGMLAEFNDCVYCMGFVKSTFDKKSEMDEIIVQPVNLFKSDWGRACFPTIYDAVEGPRTESSDNKLQQECIKAWRDVFEVIRNNGDLKSLLPRINEIRRQYAIPKSINTQNDVVSLLFRRQEPWTEECQEIFLMALQDQGMWLSVFGDKISAVTNGIEERPLAKKLEERAATLTKAPLYEGESLKVEDNQTYYEQMLRFAFSLDFTNLKKMAFDWNARGFWTARKAMFTNLFDKDDKTLEELKAYLKEQEDNLLNEKFIATAVYNIVNDDFMNRISYEPFVKEGLDGISSILAYIADNIEKRQEKVSVYGIHQRYLFGGEDTKSLPEAMRLLRSIIDAGILTSFRFTYFVSQPNWLKVVKYLFRSMPYPILFYTLMYTDEKLLKRVAQEYAYTDDEDVVKALPDIMQRLLKAIRNEDTPRIYIGLYIITSELYVAVNEDVWYDLFRNHVLKFFCQEDIVKNVSHNDPIYINVREGIRHIRNVASRIEVFKIMVSALRFNAYNINVLIHDYLLVDESLMENDEFLQILMDVIKNNPLNSNYMLASRYGRQKWAREELRVLIDEVAIRDGLDFGSETSNAICMLSCVIRDEGTKAKMKAILLSKNMWNCGITAEHYTAPYPIGLETVDESIGWTKEDWAVIKDNMLANLKLISGENANNSGIYQHFNKQYIDLLSNMRYFIKKIMKVEGCEVQDVSEQIEKMLQELRGFKNVVAELSSDEYDTVVEGVWYLRDRYVDAGLEQCTHEVQLLINRVLMQVPTALDHCLSFLSVMVADNPKKMTEMFGDSLLEVLNRYAKEFDYETLFVSVPSMYNWLRRIAKGIAPKYGETPAVKHWLEDEKVNRFNYVGQ